MASTFCKPDNTNPKKPKGKPSITKDARDILNSQPNLDTTGMDPEVLENTIRREP